MTIFIRFLTTKLFNSISLKSLSIIVPCIEHYMSSKIFNGQGIQSTMRGPITRLLNQTTWVIKTMKAMNFACIIKDETWVCFLLLQGITICVPNNLQVINSLIYKHILFGPLQEPRHFLSNYLTIFPKLKFEWYLPRMPTMKETSDLVHT